MLGLLFHVTLGLALTMLLRKPARQLFGPGPAFTLWLLPPLLAALCWLPTLSSTWMTIPSLLVLPKASAVLAQSFADAPKAHWLVSLWLAGTLIGLARIAIHYVGLLRKSQPLPLAIAQTLRAHLGEFDHRGLRLHPAGPAVLWAPRHLLLLPGDFLERFEAEEQRLILQHELAHLQRGDPLWNLLAELAFAALWFHPLAWLALPRLRLDQELACDERVLRQCPHDEAGYAQALLHSIGVDAAPTLIPWFAESQLKERLTMIQRHRPDALRRRIGFILLAASMAGGAFMVQATGPGSEHAKQRATADLSYNATVNPRYPESAIKNKEQGIVILDVLVGIDGKPLTIKVNPSTEAAPDLVQAASAAVMNWRFNPYLKNGKPIESYARVPVQFSLDELPDTATKNQVEKIDSKKN